MEKSQGYSFTVKESSVDSLDFSWVGLGEEKVVFVDNVSQMASEAEKFEFGVIEYSLKSFLEKKSSIQNFHTEEYSSDFKESHETDTAYRGHEQISKKLASEIIALIKSSSFEEGFLSPADWRLKEVLDVYGKDVVEKVVSHLWLHCYKAENQGEHAHFLNLLKNISYEMSPEPFLTYAVSAINHKSLMIRDAGISTFESWDIEEHRAYLESVADTGISWLDSYKKEVLENLGW